METIINIDFNILNYIHNHFSCPALDFLMPKITALGNGGAIWIVLAIIMIIFKKSRKTGIMTGTGLLTDVILGNLLLKNIIARNRPCWINDTIQLLISVP